MEVISELLCINRHWVNFDLLCSENVADMIEFLCTVSSFILLLYFSPCILVQLLC